MKTKLIRDKIPEIALSKWERLETHIADNKEYTKKLLEKILEEASEIVEASNNEEIKEEIVDLYEVIDAFLANSNISKNEILELQKSKKNKRWWFSKKIILKIK